MNSKIEQAIQDLEEYIETCKPARFQNGYIMVNKDEIDARVAELRLRTPEEIKRYQKVISNKEAILADAKTKADAIIAQANVKKEELVSEHQIMQNAYAQANEVVLIATKQAQEILDKATSDANSIRLGAIDYTDGCLKGVEQILTNALETSRARYESLNSALAANLQVVLENRAQLKPIGDDVEEVLNEEQQSSGS